MASWEERNKISLSRWTLLKCAEDINNTIQHQGFALDEIPRLHKMCVEAMFTPYSPELQHRSGQLIQEMQRRSQVSVVTPPHTPRLSSAAAPRLSHGPAPPDGAIDVETASFDLIGGVAEELTEAEEQRLLQYVGESHAQAQTPKKTAKGRGTSAPLPQPPEGTKSRRSRSRSAGRGRRRDDSQEVQTPKSAARRLSLGHSLSDTEPQTPSKKGGGGGGGFPPTMYNFCRALSTNKKEENDAITKKRDPKTNLPLYDVYQECKEKNIKIHEYIKQQDGQLYALLEEALRRAADEELTDMEQLKDWVLEQLGETRPRAGKSGPKRHDWRKKYRDRQTVSMSQAMLLWRAAPRISMTCHRINPRALFFLMPLCGSVSR
jgi:hypothetical protein